MTGRDGAELACELAGRRIMAEAAAAAGLQLLLTNVDPGSGATWGSHENYQCRAPLPDALGRLLDTHLVTRIVFSGAGGIDPRSAWVRPVLSPRACLLTARRAGAGPRRFALVSNQPSHYGSGWRLHVTAGESLLSHFAGYLRFGTTALVVYLLDRGIPVGPGPFADPPVAVLHRLNRDCGLTRLYRLHDGGRFTAVDIQRALLDDVGRRRALLPDWGPRALDRWAAALDDLAAPAGRPRLDRMIHRQLLEQLAADFDPAAGAGDPEFRAAAAALELHLRLLGPGSLFDELDAAGALRHRLPELPDERIRHACEHPPAGRASVRAAIVHRHGSHGPDHLLAAGLRLGWDAICRGAV